jgi:hypothetical protein
MTTSAPWQSLPPQVAYVLEPELPAITDEILRAIAEEVPEYARPFEGAFGQAVRNGVEQALKRFLGLVREAERPDPSLSRIYVGLGRGEFREGRTLDALQSAYRVGARVAWRHIAATGARGGLDQEILARLAEAIFAYIDELSAESVEGYALAQSERAGERERRRTAIVEALLHGASEPELVELAEQAGWELPRTAAALACAAERMPGLARRLGADAVSAIVDGVGCVVVPDAEGPGRAQALRVAVGDRPVAVGPNVSLAQLGASWNLATATLALHGDDAAGPVTADDHLGALLLREAAAVVERIAVLRLAAFEPLTPKARARMQETALAYVRHAGRPVAIARELHVHPQTARYRISRLRELLGDQLDDPDARFELEAALRRLRT